LLEDLTTIIHDIHQQGNLVVIRWDANKPIGGRDMLHFQAQTTLVSLTTKISAPFTSYARGNNIIDLSFGSPALLQYVDKCGYLRFYPFYQRAWISDHRGIFIDLVGINTSTHPVVKQPSRILASKNTKAIGKFLANVNRTECSRMLEDPNKRTSNCHWTENNHNQLEQIDKSFTMLLLKAESKLFHHYT
jgi:hypothetical protein